MYCVYLTVYGGDKLPPYYIGSTSLEKINDGYKGSVSSKKYIKIWKEELRENSYLFSTNIISIHATREEAYDTEYSLIIAHDAVNSKDYINMSNNRGLPNHKGKKLSQEHKDNVSKGVTAALTTEVRNKISNALKGRSRSKETKDKISNSSKGKPKSKEHIDNMKKKTISDKTRKAQSVAKKGKKTGPCTQKRKDAISLAKSGKGSKGKYMTPWGDFNSGKLAAKAINYAVSEDSVRKWCMHSDIIVCRCAIVRSDYLTVSSYGKSFKELGFAFEPNSTDRD